MGSRTASERRTPGGDALARALLDAREPLSFNDLMAAAPDCAPGEVAAWLGHAIAEGLVVETQSDSRPGLLFVLKARGTRLLSARRRAVEGARRAQTAA